MTSIARLLLALAMLMVSSGCGGGGPTSGLTVTGIKVQAQPSNQTADHGLAAPQDQVAFTAHYTYSDLSTGTSPVANVQWTGDGASWISLQGNTATCLQAAPVIVLPAFSAVTATATVNGKTHTDSSGLYCL